MTALGFRVSLLKDGNEYNCYAAKKLELEELESAIPEVIALIAEIRNSTYEAVSKPESK